MKSTLHKGVFEILRRTAEVSEDKIYRLSYNDIYKTVQIS
jgi:hypothetical protein